uniref:Coiled-coil domain-containing protein 93 n=1 Tax=Caenorhabditis tropicalis TaxID=1561998 RepID=A0A1I7TRC3_9PELO
MSDREGGQSSRRLTPADSEIFQEMVNALSSVGYHRARVSHVTPFDKLVGGIAWILSLFQPFVCGQQWVFIEWKGKPDTCKSMINSFFLKYTISYSMQVDQIIRAIKNMESSISVTRDDFFTPNFPVLRDIVVWLTNKVKDSEKKRKSYQHFVDCFNKLYNTNEEASKKLMSHFRRQERVTTTKTPRMELFDKSIFRDSSASGWMILAEFINYQSTGESIYRKLDHEDNVHLTEKQVRILNEVKEAYRIELQKIADQIHSSLQTNLGRDLIDKIASWIEDLKIADVLIQTESRVLMECTKYYADFKDYSDLQEKSRDTEQTLYKRVDIDRVKQLIDDAITRINTLHEALSADLKRMAGQTSSEEPDNKSEDVQKRLHILTELVPMIREAFQALSNAREQRDKDEHTIEELGKGIDDQLAKDFSSAIKKLDAIPAQLYPDPPNEKLALDIFNAFNSFVIDVRLQLTNWYCKARILLDQRLEINTKLFELKLSERRTQREAQYGKVEEEQIKQLDALLNSAKKDFDLWQKEFPEFQRLYPSDASIKNGKRKIDTDDVASKKNRY